MMTNYVLALISLVAIIPFLIMYEVSLDWRVVLVPVFLLITSTNWLVSWNDDCASSSKNSGHSKFR